MPPGNIPELTREEQQTLEKLKKVCALHGPKSSGLKQRCALLKVQQIQAYERKQSELRDIARENLNRRRQEALTYVGARINKIQNEGMLLSNALQQASGEYDVILGSKAKEPILGDIVLGLTLVVLPDLKVVARAIKGFTSGRTANLSQVKLGASIDDNWAILGAELEKKTQELAASNGKFIRFGEYLDSKSKDTIEAIKNPLGANANVDSESQKRLAAFKAKNQILTLLIKSIETRLVLVTSLEPILYKFILWYEGEDLLSFVTKLFEIIGFDSDIVYDGKAFDLFSDLILYDMLRAYVKQYFVITAYSHETIDDHHRPDKSRVEGLDSAQREMIYRRFGKVKWNDSSRPPVNNYLDLLKKWGGTFKNDIMWVCP